MTSEKNFQNKRESIYKPKVEAVIADFISEGVTSFTVTDVALRVAKKDNLLKMKPPAERKRAKRKSYDDDKDKYDYSSIYSTILRSMSALIKDGVLTRFDTLYTINDPTKYKEIVISKIQKELPLKKGKIHVIGKKTFIILSKETATEKQQHLLETYIGINNLFAATIHQNMLVFMLEKENAEKIIKDVNSLVKKCYNLQNPPQEPKKIKLTQSSTNNETVEDDNSTLAE